MSRIDKYESKAGGFRAPLGFAVTTEMVDLAMAVGLDANGRVVRGPGNTGQTGVLVLTMPKNIGDIVDVMTDGELVEFPGVAGSAYGTDAADATGDIVTPVPAGGVRLGHTVEGSRLVVRARR